MSISQSIIVPFHKNKDMLLYMLALLSKSVPSDVEIIVVGNNNDPNALDFNLPERYRFIKVYESLLYSKTANLGVAEASGDIITLCDQDIFCYNDWYTPLLTKLLSSERIGSVSSKLLNPTNNRVLDFGIAFSKYRILHPLRGTLKNYSFSRQDRIVQSVVSAAIMMRKDTYLKVGGMDIDMPYCCSDCDIGIKINQLGLENWVVASSEVYHKGSSSAKNSKSSSFDYLRSDSYSMFYAKNYGRMYTDIDTWIEKIITDFKKSHTILAIYNFVNLSTSNEYLWYADIVKKTLDIEFSDIYSFPVHIRNSRSIQLYDELPYTFLNISIPNIYFVDDFPALQNNLIWHKMRDIQNDIVLDSHGNFFLLDDIISHRC